MDTTNPSNPQTPPPSVPAEVPVVPPPAVPPAPPAPPTPTEPSTPPAVETPHIVPEPIADHPQDEKKHSVFSTLPVKMAVLAMAAVTVMGIFVFSQQGRSQSAMYNANASTKVVSQNAVVTQPSVPSPTVAGEIPLTVSYPTNGSTFTTPNIVITGKTTPASEITVNDATTKSDATGAFSQSILLNQGENIITITSVDADGNYSEREVKVTLNTSG